MRHKRSGKKLNRNSSHRKAMLRNMAVSMIICSRAAGDDAGGRLITTLSKAKFLRPFVERLVTLSKRAALAVSGVPETPERGGNAWKEWRASNRWREWVKLVSPAIAMRRRAFSMLRSDIAVSILFDELARRFESRKGGYVRVIRIASFRVGDSGQKALVEFVGQRDRRKVSAS